MTVLAISALAFGPGIFWLWYFYRKDKLEPEPRSLVVKVFFLGLLIAVPVALIEVLVDALFPWSEILSVALFGPVVEEYAKFFVVKRTVYGHKEFDEPMDGIVYAAAAALGFASIENVAYLLSYASSVGAFTFVFVTRALLSVPGHALFSAMWGYALGVARFSREGRRSKPILLGLILSMSLHGLFNLFLTISPLGPLGALILVPVMWKIVHRRIAKALARSPHVLPPQPAEPTPEGPP